VGGGGEGVEEAGPPRCVSARAPSPRRSSRGFWPPACPHAHAWPLCPPPAASSIRDELTKSMNRWGSGGGGGGGGAVPRARPSPPPPPPQTLAAPAPPRSPFLSFGFNILQALVNDIRP
jgi:hypothetical protein